jgi:RNA polymerase sigma-70 factor, ECF subfamily
VQAARSRNLSPEAIQKLVDGHRQFLAFVRSRVKSHDAAEDILQSAFVRGLDHGSELRAEESVVAWFYRVLRNAVIDYYREQASTERALEVWQRDFAPPDVPAPDARDEICRCMAFLLQTLKPEYREALEIVDVGEGTLTELAQRSGITSGNAAVRIHRAREALRKQVFKACSTCAKHGCFDCRCASADQAAGCGPRDTVS